MGMVDELLRPGMERRKHANAAAHMARIAGQFDNGLRRGLHEQRAGGFLPAAQRLAQVLGHGDGDMEVMAGQKFALPRLEPSLRLIRMAFGTAPVPAGMAGIELLAAAIAAPEMSAERLRAAGKNVRDGAAMRGRNACAMRRKVAVREAAEDVRNLDHGWRPGLQAGHQPIEDGFERGAGRFGEVSITGRRLDAGVPKQNLHDPGIDAAFQEPCGVAVPERMRADAPLDAGVLGRRPEGLPERQARDWPGAAAAGAKPARIAMRLPKAAQRGEDRPGQGNQPFLVALADDAEQSFRAVDMRHFNLRGFADAQAAGVHQKRRGPDGRLPYAANKGARFGVR